MCSLTLTLDVQKCSHTLLFVLDALHHAHILAQVGHHRWLNHQITVWRDNCTPSKILHVHDGHTILVPCHECACRIFLCAVEYGIVALHNGLINRRYLHQRPTVNRQMEPCTIVANAWRPIGEYYATFVPA